MVGSRISTLTLTLTLILSVTPTLTLTLTLILTPHSHPHFLHKNISHIHTITAKANKLLGLLKRTCPLLYGVSVRRSLYLSLVKSQLFYATQVWSPAYVTLNAKVEQVQRRASRWMLRTRKDESSYKDRLTLLDYFHFL